MTTQNTYGGRAKNRHRSRSNAKAGAVLAGLLVVGLIGCATQSAPADKEFKTADDRVRAGIGDAALAPLSDLNLRRTPIPLKLKAMNSPYDPAPSTCFGLKREIEDLTAILGRDRDQHVASNDDKNLSDIASEEAADYALDTVESAATSFIPFRSVVRRATGATAHEKALRDAYEKGVMRRAYLKGLGQAMQCQPPASPYPAIEQDDRIEYRRADPED